MTLDAKIELELKKLYDRLAPFRRIPPPENLARSLLLRIQEHACLICSIRQSLASRPFVSESHLVEDHDHETGMVRALLCKQCNVSEGRSDWSVWPFYRRFAPANGWYYRYDGWGAQWQPEDPDPLTERIKLDNESVEEYERAIEENPATPISFLCLRRFDLAGRPILLPWEQSGDRTMILSSNPPAFLSRRVYDTHLKAQQHAREKAKIKAMNLVDIPFSGND